MTLCPSLSKKLFVTDLILFCDDVNRNSLGDHFRIDARMKMLLWVFMAMFGFVLTNEDIGPDTCGKDRTKLSNW